MYGRYQLLQGSLPARQITVFNLYHRDKLPVLLLQGVLARYFTVYFNNSCPTNTVFSFFTQGRGSVSSVAGMRGTNVEIVLKFQQTEPSTSVTDSSAAPSVRSASKRFV